ncbi:WG containing repeat-containing protein [Collimonas sp. OK607]|uniref:WG repeat-containing protein n=1 Tax=Collimonas sp. OK607 TaxID=1798194 RepID=UPI0008EEFD5E|nr:WG repeat-containing protein [Collimonas sp. OK607]SFB24844.1 WG containing repeat-containing protein [Collimonas sp. OK607]
MRAFKSLFTAFACYLLLAAQLVRAEEPRKTYHSFCGKGRFGIFSEAGKVLIAPQYDQTDIYLERGVIRVKNHGKVGTVDLQGKTLLPAVFDMISPSTAGLWPARIGNVYFYLNEKGEPAFDFTAAYAPDFRFGFAAVPLLDDRQILIDRSGETLFEVKSRNDLLLVLSPQVAVYMTDSGSGWIDLASRKVHPSQPGFLELANGALVAQVEYGPLQRTANLLDRQNRKTRTIDGYIAITKDRKILVQDGITFRLLEMTSREIIDPGHTSGIDGQKHAAFTFWHDGKQGLVNDQGRIILPPLYDNISVWSNGTTMITRNGRVGLVNDLGKVIVPPVHEAVEWLKDGRIPVKSAERWGFIDESGKTVIPFEYEAIHGFDEGIAEVKKGDRWLKIDTKGRLFLPPEYAQEYAWFEGDVLAVPKERDGCKDYFDRSGKAVFKSVIDQDGTERFIDVLRNKTIWSSREMP